MNPRAYWAGLPCALSALGQPAPFAYRRARGLEPSVSEVSFPRSLFRSATLAAKLDLRRFIPPPDEEPAGLSLPLDVPALALPVDEPPYMGDLVVVQGEGEEQRVLRARALYLDQALVATPRLDNPLVHFTLSDIRKWWENYGEITRSWNVRVGAGRALSQGFGTQVEVGTTQLRGTAGAAVYVASTARNNGRDPVPLREIVQAALNALPGRLQIMRWPVGVGEGADAPEVRCWAARPKEVLRGLLNAFRLSLDIGPDLRARVYGPGEGTIGELPDGGLENLSSWDPETGAGPWASRITADGNRYARRPTGAPTSVVVVGDRTVYDVQQDFCTPVLVYPLEREGEPPETVVLEVTPRSLAALALGVRQPEQIGQADLAAGGPILTDPLERAAVNVLMGADAPPIPSVVQSRETNVPQQNLAGSGFGLKASTFAPLPEAPPPQPVATQADPYAWQRLPLYDDDAYETAYSWASPGLRKLLREQLWRYWQIPIRRLCPLLKRAERSLAGDRLEIQVEAFTFRAVRYRRLKPKDTAEADKERAEKVRLRGWILEQIERMKETRDRLRDPTIIELSGALARTLLDHDPIGGRDPQRQAAINLLPNFVPVLRLWPFPTPEPTSASTEIQDQATFDRANTAIGAGLRKWLTYFTPAASAVGLGPDFQGVLNDLSADIPETREGRLDRLDKDIEDYTKAAADLFRELEPRLALVARLMALESEITAARRATGEDPPALVLERERVTNDLAALVEREKERQRAESQPDYEERTSYENLSRVRVDARVVDAELGIIEVLGSLPGWIADPSVNDAVQSYLVPMPVRVTFGSWNARDFEGRGEVSEGTVALGEPVPSLEYQHNPYMAATAQFLANLSGEALSLIGSLGHRLPAQNGLALAGEGQYRKAFSRTEQAIAAGEPYRWVVTMHESPPFRELVRLDGSSNREELDARAGAVVQALLGTPDSTDAGSLTLAWPMSVGCNGRISAVEVRLIGPEGFTTEVGFDGDEEPLPGITGHAPEGGPLRLTFGLDVDATRDR